MIRSLQIGTEMEPIYLIWLMVAGPSLGGLAYHNKCLDRLPIVPSSLPVFSTAQDLVMVSLYAHILHCLLLVSGKTSLDEYLKTMMSWDKLHSHTHLIMNTMQMLIKYRRCASDGFQKKCNKKLPRMSSTKLQERLPKRQQSIQVWPGTN